VSHPVSSQACSQVTPVSSFSIARYSKRSSKHCKSSFVVPEKHRLYFFASPSFRRTSFPLTCLVGPNFSSSKTIMPEFRQPMYGLMYNQRSLGRRRSRTYAAPAPAPLFNVLSDLIMDGNSLNNETEAAIVRQWHALHPELFSPNEMESQPQSSQQKAATAVKERLQNLVARMKRLEEESFDNIVAVPPNSMPRFTSIVPLEDEIRIVEDDEEDASEKVMLVDILVSEEDLESSISFQAVRSELSYLSEESRQQVERAFRLLRETEIMGVSNATAESLVYLTSHFVHEIAVVRVLASVRADAPTITAAILRGPVYNKSLPLDKLERQCGAGVRKIIEREAALSKMPELVDSWDDDMSKVLREACFYIAQDVRPIMLKLATRVHELRNLEALPVWQQHVIALETMQIWAVLAHGIGVGRIMWELEDLAFRALFPQSYVNLEKWIQVAWDHHQKLLDDAQERLMTALTEDESVQAMCQKVVITARAKNVFSTYKKLLKSGAYAYHDYLGLRVIVHLHEDSDHSESDVCHYILERIHTLWGPVAGRVKNYIEEPKPNGYRSLHTTVRLPDGRTDLEVQIRTHTMHQEAEYGFASHALYKSGMFEQDSAEQQRWISWLEEIGVEQTPLLSSPSTDIPLFKSASV